jgi:hypothetical protein
MRCRRPRGAHPGELEARAARQFQLKRVRAPPSLTQTARSGTL